MCGAACPLREAKAHRSLALCGARRQHPAAHLNLSGTFFRMSSSDEMA